MYQSLVARPVVGQLSLSGLSAVAGIAGPLVLLVADFVAAQSAPDYLLLRDSISSLAWSRLGWIQTIGFLAIGLLVEVFTAGLFLSIRGAKGFGFGVLLLGCFGFGLLLVGAFHTDITGRPNTIDGTIHVAAANTVFWLLPIASLFMVPTLKRNAYWSPIFIYSVATAVFALLWLIVYRLWLPTELSWFGLYERILVIAEVAWVEVMAIWLLRYSVRVARKARMSATAD